MPLAYAGMEAGSRKSARQQPVAHWLLELRRRKITVICIRHAGRNGFMRGHTKREDACSWILELRDAKKEDEPGAKFVSHFTKPSRNTGESLPDLLWHFTTDPAGRTHIHCETAQVTDYEQFIQHVCEGGTSQRDIAERMNKNKGTGSKWARKGAAGPPAQRQPRQAAAARRERHRAQPQPSLCHGRGEHFRWRGC